MIDPPEATATRPYLIRALHEWCNDNGFTPYLAVSVDDSVQVPREYVKDGEIVLNISIDATSSLQLGNDFIAFKSRFAGTARDIMVPVTQVTAIYARENGQGMAFPLGVPKGIKPAASVVPVLIAQGGIDPQVPEVKLVQLVSVDSDRSSGTPDGEPEPPRPIAPRPSLKRIK
ncbi:MAG: stringent starvation protein B [Rhodoferax sp.]|jgi:stringent starvation protein B